MSFEKFEGIRETVDAWVRCGCDPEFCSKCMDKGGHWHEALEKYNPFREDQYRLKGTDATGVETQVATKSSKLTREHDVCAKCDGAMEVKWCINKAVKWDSGRVGAIPNCTEMRECRYCKGTGAEPDTAGEWRVSDE